MSVKSDLIKIKHLAGKGVYTGATQVDLFAGYVMLLILSANDEVAAAKRKSKTQLMTNTPLDSPVFQYCVEACSFISKHTQYTLKKSVLFYVSAIFFFHQEKNKVDRYVRVSPKEINAPKVRRFISRVFSSPDNGDFISRRTILPSDELSYCLASALDTTPDTFDTLVSKLPEALNDAYLHSPKYDPERGVRLLKVAESLPEDVRSRVLLEMCLQNGVSYSYSAYTMIYNWYINNPLYDLGKQSSLVNELIVMEAKRRNLYFPVTDYSIYEKAGYPIDYDSGMMDLTKFYEGVD